MSSTKTQELNICMELSNKYPETKEFLRKDRTYKISKQKHILDIITEQNDINKFMEFANLYLERRPHKNSPPSSPPQQSANGNVVLAIDVKDDEEIKKLTEKNKKLKEKLERSIKVNEELRKENKEHIPELEAKNMLQFQEIWKLKEENKKLLDDIQLHPDYEDTIRSTKETAEKPLKEKIESMEETIESQKKNLHKFIKLLSKNKIKW